MFVDSQNHAHSYEDQVRYFIYVMERAMYAADMEGVGTICWLGDYTGWTLRNNPPFKMSMELLAIVQRHYPCLIGNNLILNHPTYFQVLYSSLSPFFSAQTMAKIKFVNKNELKEKVRPLPLGLPRPVSRRLVAPYFLLLSI